MTMALEDDRQDAPHGLGNEPLQAPPAEQLEEENPTQSPAQPAEGETETDRDAARKRASTSMDSLSQPTKSTEGLTVGGTEKTLSD
jgi:hypothetical protein